MSSREAVLWHHFDDLEQQHEANILGMWTFLATEVLIFGGVFTGYFAYWTYYPRAFVEGSQHLNLWIAAVNTIVLLTSSLTMALAIHAIQHDRRRALTWLLVATAALGSLFLVLKFVEYYLDYREDLVPGLAWPPHSWFDDDVNPEHVKLFMIFYYVFTGLHAVHLTIGIAVMKVLIFLSWRGWFTKDYYTPVESWGLYWHFVDIVWIFLLPLLYLIGTHHG